MKASIFVCLGLTSLLNIGGHIAQCAATQECHAADTGHDTPPCHSIQTRGGPVAVLSIDVERHTGIHSHPF